MTAGKSVLLVEDNELNRDMMVRRLNRAGLQVTTAGNGQQALEIMHAEQPSVVLMDMNLPILDGWAASRRAKEDNVRVSATAAARVAATPSASGGSRARPRASPSVATRLLARSRRRAASSRDRSHRRESSHPDLR